MEISIDSVERVLIPIATLVAGWIGAVWKSSKDWARQKEELKQQQEQAADARHKEVYDMMSSELTRLYGKVAELETKIDTVQDNCDKKMEKMGVKVDAKKKAIRQAYNCKYYKEGHDCPVIIEDDKNEAERMKKAELDASRCDTCPHNEGEPIQ